MTLRIDLPWPSPNLHPNSRVHWSKRSASAKRARMDANLATLGAMNAQGRPKLGAGEIVLTLTFRPPPVNRKRDADNLLAAMKSALDGVADALKVDDWRFAFTLRAGDPVKGGMVVVEVA